MKRTLYLLLAVLPFFALCACQTSRFSDPDNRFSIELPKNWVACPNVEYLPDYPKEYHAEDFYFIPEIVAADTIYPIYCKIIVRSNELPMAPQSYDELREKLLRIMPRDEVGRRIPHKEELIDNVQVFTYGMSNLRKGQTSAMVLLTAIYYSSRNTYSVILRTNTLDFNRNKEKYAEFMRSLRIVDTSTPDYMLLTTETGTLPTGTREESAPKKP